MFPLQSFSLSPSADTLVHDPASDVMSAPVRLRADAGDDLFFEPGQQAKVGQLRTLGRWTTAEFFQFSARVSVEFHATFDSGVLLGWFDPDHWFKICAELDPQGRTRIVSVVTRGRSDDANGAFFSGSTARLRISRLGRVFALHSSTDGERWDLVRLFEIGEGPTARVFVGVAVQSPTGSGTTGQFDDILFSRDRLDDARDAQ